MRSTVVKALKPLHAVAVENPCWLGTPDVNYVEGWIELKWLRSWPKYHTSVVRLDHYTQQQRIFAWQRRHAGGQCWFLLQCRREWLLLDGAVAAMVVNRSTRRELLSYCDAYWKAGLPGDDLIRLLQQRQAAFHPTKIDIERFRENL